VSCSSWHRGQQPFDSRVSQAKTDAPAEPDLVDVLANDAHHPWAADLLTVPTVTFKRLYVLVFITHGARWSTSTT